MISYEELSKVFDMDNTLTLEYFELCDKDSNDKVYIEAHHILPKSLFPEYEKSKWNLIRLSYRDHYRTHEILPQIITNGEFKLKMLRAWWLMTTSKKSKSTSSDDYEKLRKQWSDHARESFLGDKNPMFGISMSDETKKLLSDINSGERHPRYGKEVSSETRNKIAASLLGKPQLHNRMTSETFTDYLSEHTGLKLVSEFVMASLPVTLKCQNENHPAFSARPSLVIFENYGCKYCSGHTKLVEVGGIRYKSIASACRSLAISTTNLKNMLTFKYVT